MTEPHASLEVFGDHRVVPVVVLDDPGRAEALGRALVDGGIPVAEVTFRTPLAAAVLNRLAGNTDLVVGAGTVLTPDQVDLALDAGATFVVSPGLSEAVVRRCQELDVPVFPGVSTPTELIRALELGVDVVKFFPAEANGGLATIGALAPAFPQVRFVPTGGITAETAPTYLAHPSVAAVGGSWMVTPALLASAQWDEVAVRCRSTVVTTAEKPLLQGAPA